MITLEWFQSPKVAARIPDSSYHIKFLKAKIVKLAATPCWPFVDSTWNRRIAAELYRRFSFQDSHDGSIGFYIITCLSWFYRTIKQHNRYHVRRSNHTQHKTLHPVLCSPRIGFLNSPTIVFYDRKHGTDNIADQPYHPDPITTSNQFLFLVRLCCDWRFIPTEYQLSATLYGHCRLHLVPGSIWANKLGG